MNETSTTVTPIRTKYIPQLDGLRALAVLAVVIFHARSNFLPGGFIGVDVFFVLSGFLITTIIVAEISTKSRFSFKRFYVRRALRLFPALFLACGVLGLFYWLVPNVPHREESLLGTAGAVTYTSSWIMALQITDLGTMVPTWSLGVEEHFYLIWPFLLVLGLKLHRRVPWLAPTMIIAAVVYPVAMHVFFGWSPERLYYAPDTRAGQLFIGCATAVILPKLKRSVPGIAALVAALLLVSFALFKERFSFDVYSTVGIVVIPLLAAVIIAHIAAIDRGAAYRVLSSRPMVWIGQRSYGIYLWNLPLIGALWFLGSSPLSLGIKVVVCLMVPALSFVWIERPFLRMKRLMR